MHVRQFRISDKFRQDKLSVIAFKSSKFKQISLGKAFAVPCMEIFVLKENYKLLENYKQYRVTEKGGRIHNKIAINNINVNLESKH